MPEVIRGRHSSKIHFLFSLCDKNRYHMQWQDKAFHEGKRFFVFTQHKSVVWISLYEKLCI